MTSTRTTVKTTYETRGSEPLTVKTLLAVLQDYPIDAEIVVETGETQRDGAWWRISSVYDRKKS